jgi:tetratricopeptide (TPR) repeat protein
MRFDGGAAALVAALGALSRHAQAVEAAYAEQVPNAVALARAVLPRDLPTVAFTFKAFDKAAKAWGDLTATHDLANLSSYALKQLLDGNLSEDDQRRYAAWRAQTFICGQGWVYQRVERLDDARNFMHRAKEITDQYDDAENRAYALKCEGRLLRMEAEELDEDDAHRRDLLTQSAELLRLARPAFEHLLLTNPRFVEDRGECVSLLARTVAAQHDLDQALQLAEEARGLLAPKPDSKAMADLLVLFAEIDLAIRPDGPATVLADHGDALRDLLARHAQKANGRLDRSRSEVTARVREVLAVLHLAVGDREVGHGLLLEASEQYERLGYDGRRDRIRWRAQLVSGQQAPTELLAALEEARMPDGARIRVIERYVERYGGFPEVGAVEATPPPLDAMIIDSMIRRAVAEQAAASPVWGEQPTSA